MSRAPRVRTRPGEPVKAYQTYDMSGPPRRVPVVTAADRFRPIHPTEPAPVAYHKVPFSSPDVTPTYEYMYRAPAYKSQDPNQQLRSYQPMDLTGHRYYQPAPPRNPADFFTVQSRPFTEPPDKLHSHTTNTGSAFIEPQYGADGDGGPIRYIPDDRIDGCPQSRTFKILQSVMQNEEQAAGVSGLPGPRSVTMEEKRREIAQQYQQPDGLSSPRVKVLMPQQYNSPLGMYSAGNAIESFTVQAATAIESLERSNLQNRGEEQEPVHGSSF